MKRGADGGTQLSLLEFCDLTQWGWEGWMGGERKRPQGYLLGLRRASRWGQHGEGENVAVSEERKIGRGRLSLCPPQQRGNLM